MKHTIKLCQECFLHTAGTGEGRQDTTTQNKTKQGKTRQDKQDKSRQYKAGQDKKEAKLPRRNLFAFLLLQGATARQQDKTRHGKRRQAGQDKL